MDRISVRFVRYDAARNTGAFLLAVGVIDDQGGLDVAVQPLPGRGGSAGRPHGG